MNKIMVAGMTLCGFWLVVVGCRGKEPQAESNDMSKSVVGQYHNQQDFGEFIDLKPDGTAFWREKVPSLGSATEYSEQAGKWKVYGSELALIGPLGDVNKARINDRTILVDGKTWVGEVRADELPDRIPGKYSVELIVGGEVQRPSGNAYCVFSKNGSVSYHREDYDDSGVWKIEGGLIQIDGPDGQKKLVDGRVYGNDMVFVVNEAGDIQKLVKEIPGGSSSGPISSPQAQPNTPSPDTEISRTEMIWVKCKSCGESYQMSKRQYYVELDKKAKAASLAMMTTPALTCQKCSKHSVFLAEKCPNCSEVFFMGSIPNDFPDRCPDCKHSKTEDTRRAPSKQGIGESNAELQNTALQKAIQEAKTWEPCFEQWTSKVAPDFILTDIEGNTVHLSDYRGKNIIVVFFGSWSGPDRQYTECLKALRDAYSSEKLAILAISREQRDVLKKFATERHINYTVVLSSDNLPSPYKDIQNIPTTFFVNSEGRIDLVAMGMMQTSDAAMIVDAQ